MTLKQITGLGKELTLFLALFANCFCRREGRGLLRVYVKGQLSDLHRKTAEAIALQFSTSPRTLQRFLESIKWNEEQLRDRCQQIVAAEHAHPLAIGCIDESGTTKSGKETVGVGRQYNGNRGKIDNCTVGVHLSYSAPGFQVLLDSRLYLPEDFANDPARRKKHTSPRRSSFRPSPKSQSIRSIALWATGFAFLLGRSTSCTDATAPLDHYEVRGWRCVHRHFYVTQLSHLFCARVRQKYDDSSDEEADRISVEQVRSAMNVYLDAVDLSAPARKQRFEDELHKQQYYQRRNRHARKSHTKTRLAKLAALGIDVSRIKSCLHDTG